MRILLTIVLLGACAAPAGAQAPPADLAPCDMTPPPPEPTPAEERYQAGRDFRESLGLPSSRAAIERAERHPRRRRPMEANGAALTPREYAYFSDRLRLQEKGDEISRYERRFRSAAGGISIEDDYPAGAYFAIRFTRDVARHRAALRRIARVRFRVLRVRYSERELIRLQNRIDDDALERAGINFEGSGVDVTANRVKLMVTTRRSDAARLVRRRYGRAVRVIVIAKERFAVECQALEGYTLEQPARLRLRWGHSGSVDLERTVLREEPDRVIVGVVIRVPNGGLNGDLQIRNTPVDLAAPLGDRQVIDASTGRPLRVAPADPFGPEG